MDYKELDVWKETRELVGIIYENTAHYPIEESFGLKSQIRKSSVSVSANIAEGCGRGSTADTIRFLYMARGSLYELETELYLSYDQKYIELKVLNNLLIRIIKCKNLLNGFISYLRNRMEK